MVTVWYGSKSDSEVLLRSAPTTVFNGLIEIASHLILSLLVESTLTKTEPTKGAMILVVIGPTIELIRDLRSFIELKGRLNDSDPTIFCVETSINFRSISYCVATVLISPIKM